MDKLRLTSWVMMVLIVFGSFAPFATTAPFTNPTSAGFTGQQNFKTVTNTYQSSSPTFDDFYKGSFDTYWPILNNLEEDQCDSVNSDFIIGIPPGGCSPMVVRSDLLAEQNIPVFCQLSAIRVNPLIDVSTIKSISFKQKNQSDLIAGISFHPARAAIKSYKTLLGSPIDENIGYVVIVLKQQPDERNLEEKISGMLTATVTYDAQGAFATGAAEYYLDKVSDPDWQTKAVDSSFWAGKGYLRLVDIENNEAIISVLTGKDDVYKTVTLEEGETSNKIYYPGQYCTAVMQLKLNKIDNSEDMAKINIDGDTFWVREGSKFLDGKCVVRNLNVFPSDSGSLDISCSGSSKFTLVLGDSGAVLNNGTNISVGIGGSIKGKVEGKEKDIYLGYYGKNGIGEFVILFNKAVSEDDVGELTKIFDFENFDLIEDMKTRLNEISKFKDKYEIVIKGGMKYGITVKEIGFNGGEVSYQDSTFIPKYLDLSGAVVSELIDTFPAEKKSDGKTYWGEEALIKQISLAHKANDKQMQIDLINSFLSEYPGSDSVEYMRDLKLSLEKFDQTGASANVLINNNYYNIRVDGFAGGTGASDSATVSFRGGADHSGLRRNKVYDVSKNFEEIIDVKTQGETFPRLTILDIDGSSAKLRYTWRDSNNNDRIVNSEATINVQEYGDLGGVEARVSDTKVREVAYVSLIPEVKNTKTEANFTFNIEVEKRAIEISPEKAKKKVDALNKSIARWEEKIDKLGELVKGLKAACLVTSTVLTLKSFVSGFTGGAAIARGKVMEIYEAKCKTEHRDLDLQVCYSTYYKENIEKDIEAHSTAITGVNEGVAKCRSESAGVSSGFLENTVVDNDKYINCIKKQFGIKGVVYVTSDGTEIDSALLTSVQDVQAVLLYRESCSVGEMDYIKGINSGSGLINNNELSVSCRIAKSGIDSALSDNVDRIRDLAAKEESKSAFGVEIPVARYRSENAGIAQTVSAKGTSIVGVNASNFLVNVNDPEHPTNLYIVEVNKDGDIEKVYNKTNEKAVNDKGLVSRLSSSYDYIIPSGKSDSCSNVMVQPYVRYYESGNKQGFVEVVPIDKEEGWYARISNGDYKDNGVPKKFNICNVGSDGLIGEDDMICQGFRLDDNNREFISCEGFDASSLYKKAEKLISEANKNGKGVYLDGEFIASTTPIKPDSTGLECTDFMSVDDCNLMFNVCDPVICPTSRCDLGGKFPVSDVIASGIIGSIALCLPNFGNPAEGGVAIPICLSGIHAGLDAYVSILRSHRDCLIENIQTGRYTGICDEITAIYTCEFFWGQISPILDTLLTRVVEGLYGGFQTKGGAEYLTIQKSFENLDKSVDYFADNYMQNSFRAFNLKNTEEIGSTVCKGFVGSSVPTSADVIDSLLEPESPSQFYAYFSDNVFSEATVPSTSHYKVYYHIYAGNDAGAQYKVYLKSPPESSYYATRQTITVDSGYAAKGIAADESIDFTAPTGYKELCVDINGEPECGFGSVTSDFGLNYASQAYVADQVDDKQITSTEDCVTTSTSAWAMASPNLQAGVEKALGEDDIATTGIVRVCASINPEKGVIGGNDVYCKPSLGVESNSACAFGYSCVAAGGETDSDIGICKNTKTDTNQISQGKWIDVGYCDNQNMRCWLDSTSVKDNLGQYAAVNGVTSISELIRDSEDLIELKEQFKNVAEKLSVLNKGILELQKLPSGKLIDSKGNLLSDVQNIITGLDEVSGAYDNIGQGSNAAKAQALSMKASIYRLVVEKLIKNNGLVLVKGDLYMELPGDSSKIVRWDRTKGIIAHGTLEGGEKVTWTRIPDNEIMDVSDDISEKRKANWGGTSDGPPEVDDADNINGAGVSIDPLLSSALDLLKKNFIDPQPKIWKEDLKYSDNSEFAAFVDDLFIRGVLDGEEYYEINGKGASNREETVRQVWNRLSTKRDNGYIVSVVSYNLDSALALLKKNFIDPQPKIWKEDLKYSDNSEFAAFVDDLFRSKVMDGKEYDVVFGAGVSYFEKDVTYVWNLLMSKRRN